MHRDIKPENFLIQYDKNCKKLIKCSDFDLAKPISEKTQDNTVNHKYSFNYASPQ